jgi:FG-GAP-like repeat/PQQ-like domain
MPSKRSILPLALLSLFAAFYPSYAADVLTYHNDNARTGWNPNEVTLTPSNVNASSFGLKFNLPVDGKVDAQPLYASNAPVYSRGSFAGNHDLVIVATEHDTVYAFDADTGALYWRASLLGPGETPSDDRGCGQVTPEIGITATPVIDRTAGISGTDGTIYVVAMSKASGPVYHQRLHALNLATGQDARLVEIQASYPGSGPHNDVHGHVIFDPGAYKERPGLLLLNGIVYTAWSSHCDIAPYTSWIIGYSETTLAQVSVLNCDPNGPPNNTFLSDGSGNAFWNSGAGPAADANGNIYALSANGPFDTKLVNGFPSGGDYGDTFLKLSPQGSLHVSDYFTPFDQAASAAGDTDLGSGGAVVLPDMTDANGRTRHLAVGTGKDSNIYLVDRDNMGKFIPGGTSNTNIYEELAGALPGGEWGTAAYFNGAVYYGPVGGVLRKFTFTLARLNPTPAATTSTVFHYPGVTPSISSSGNNSGIVWAYENPDSGSNQAVLHAYDAADLHELYNSNQIQFGVANKFITPTICNGKVFVGTTNSVGVFGLLPSGGKAGVAKDFNNRGFADLIWEESVTGQRLIWLMHKGVPIFAVGLPTVDPSWHIAGVGDFLGNGQSDLVWERTDGEHLIWILVNGVPQYAISLLTVGGGWHVVGAGDFNGDGKADLVWENSVTGQREIWLMNNGTPTTAIQLETVDPIWHIAGVGDFLGNGQADLVWENSVTGQREIWLMNNGTSTSAINLPTVDPSWHIGGAGDFMGTGNADLVWENNVTGERLIWVFNNGQPTSAIALPTVPPTWHIVDH